MNTGDDIDLRTPFPIERIAPPVLPAVYQLEGKPSQSASDLNFFRLVTFLLAFTTKGILSRPTQVVLDPF